MSGGQVTQPKLHPLGTEEPGWVFGQGWYCTVLGSLLGVDGLAGTEVVGLGRGRTKQVGMSGLAPIFTTAEHGADGPNASVGKGGHVLIDFRPLHPLFPLVNSA